jgi:hypothetical protein
MFVARILMVTLEKTHVTLVTNDKDFEWKKKSMKYTFILDWPYMYCHLQLGCDFLGEQWEQVMCCHISQLLKYYKYFYYKYEIF